jgi:periplasmic divalent cation tolerance protein
MSAVVACRAEFGRLLSGETVPATREDLVTEGYSAVMTSIDSADAAAELARGMVEARLAACAKVIGLTRSFYRWEGRVHDEQEWVCWAKTTADRVPELQKYIKENHSYDVPEIIVLSIDDGSPEYLKWLTDETRPA